VLVPAVSAIDIPCESENAGQCNLVKSRGDLSDNIWKIVSFALGILGGVAVIVIIIAGILYTISAGDAGKVKKAKNTILYAVVGLVVAMLSSAIIAFINGFFV
jgi:hypothetical protein